MKTAYLFAGASTPSRVFAPDRGITYWKNHESHMSQMIGSSPIQLGDTTVSTTGEGVDVLSSAKARDARDALRAQLLATILNLRNGSDPFAIGKHIGSTVDEAVDFLSAHAEPLTGKHPDRDRAISLKDILDKFNNSGEG